MADAVTNIADHAFEGCAGLVSLGLGKGLISIRPSAFEYCGLLGLRIPDRVTTIDSNAFRQCVSITNLTMGSNVVSIGEHAFELCYSLGSLTLPRNLASIGQYAFANCSVLDLFAVYFQGNSPAADCTVFTNYGNFSAAPNNVTVYYLPGTTGWGPTFACVPAKLWNPQAQTTDANFGVRMDRFGFNITGTADIPLAVEASTDLAARSWVLLQSCTLTNGSIYFSDPQWTNYPSRLYRIRSP
jgi:hypothetical protein